MQQIIPGMISVAAAGTIVTSGAASAEVAIPVGANGAVPSAVHIACVTPAGAAHVKAVRTGTAATTSDLCVTFGAPVILWVKGQSHIAHIQEVAASKLNITPLET